MKVLTLFATAAAASAAFAAFPAGAVTLSMIPSWPPGTGAWLSVQRRPLSAPVPIATLSWASFNVSWSSRMILLHIVVSWDVSVLNFLVRMPIAACLVWCWRLMLMSISKSRSPYCIAPWPKGRLGSSTSWMAGIDTLWCNRETSWMHVYSSETTSSSSLSSITENCCLQIVVVSLVNIQKNLNKHNGSFICSQCESSWCQI